MKVRITRPRSFGKEEKFLETVEVKSIRQLKNYVGRNLAKLYSTLDFYNADTNENIGGMFSYYTRTREYREYGFSKEYENYKEN